MNVIVEGVDGVGKTTLIRQIADELDCDILALTRRGSKNFDDYVAKAALKRIVADRSFLSEIVYCTVFDRPCCISPFQVEELMKCYRKHGWQFYLLDADSETIRKRLIARGDEDPANIERIDSLRAVYKAFAYFFNIPIIDSEHLEVHKFIADLKG